MNSGTLQGWKMKSFGVGNNAKKFDAKSNRNQENFERN